MAAYMRDKIGDDIMHDNQTLCYGMLDVRDMGLPVVGLVITRLPWTGALILPMQKWPHMVLKWRWYSFLNMQMKVARARSTR